VLAERGEIMADWEDGGETGKAHYDQATGQMHTPRTNRARRIMHTVKEPLMEAARAIEETGRIVENRTDAFRRIDHEDQGGGTRKTDR
jgi:hypothetical protein